MPSRIGATNTLNPFGLLHGDANLVVRVDDVPRGLDCDCTCAKCGGRFVAVKPDSGRQPYFRHHSGVDCGGSFETAIHLMAKQILVESRTLMLPYLKVQPSRHLWKHGTSLKGYDSYVVKRQRMTFDRVEDEVHMGERVPDVVMWKQDRRLLVEIVVTHGISEEKYEWLRANDLATVKVNMSWATASLTRSKLAKALHDGRMIGCIPRLNIVSWVHHPGRVEAQKMVDAAYVRSLTDGTNVPMPLPSPTLMPRKPTGQGRLFD